MVSLDVLRNVAGIVGTVISSGLFLSAVPTFWKIIKRKSVGEYIPDPYLAMLFNCTLWAFYGLPFVRPDSMLVVTVNGIGILVEAIYLIIFFVFAPNKERRRMLRGLGIEAVLMAALALGVLLGARTHEVRSMIVGTFCVVAGTMMYAGHLTVMSKVVETKNAEYIPVFLSLMDLLNGACWTAYALINFDMYIIVTYGLGALLSYAQLILYMWYYKSTPQTENVELPNVCPKPNNTINGSNNFIAVEQQAEEITLLNAETEAIFY